MQIQKRNLWIMLLLFLITGGLYLFYWLYKTKQEINSTGGNIPTFWLAIIPLVHFYFLYRYAREFVVHVRKEKDDRANMILYILLMIFFPMPGMFIIQYQLNRYADGVHMVR